MIQHTKSLFQIFSPCAFSVFFWCGMSFQQASGCIFYLVHIIFGVQIYIQDVYRYEGYFQMSSGGPDTLCALWCPKFHFGRGSSIPSSPCGMSCFILKINYVILSMWLHPYGDARQFESGWQILGHLLRVYIFWSICGDCFMEVYLYTALLLLVDIFMIKSWVIFVINHIARFFQHIFPVKVFGSQSHFCNKKNCLC